MQWRELIDEAGWFQAVEQDPEALLIGRWSRFELQLDTEDASNTYVYSLGRFSGGIDPDRGQGRIVLVGSYEAWSALLAAVPVPPNHHPLGMERRRNDFRVAGDRQVFIRHLRLVTRMIEIARGCRVVMD